MLIGKNITIKEAKNNTINGKHGIVIDETKHTLTLRTNQPSEKPNKKNSTTKPHNNATHKDITIIKDQIITIEETP
jgi:RNase P/RNase MRP subunit p29